MTALTVLVTFVVVFLFIFVGYITELKNIYQTSQRAITDDETTLHKFCVKLETVMRHEQKGRYSHRRRSRGGGAGGSLAPQTKSRGDRALSRFGPEKHFYRCI